MVRKSEREEATHRIELSGFDFHAAGGDTGGKIDLVDGGIARFGLDRHVGEAVFGLRTVAERNNVGGKTGNGDKFAALGAEHAELVGQILV